MGEISLQDAMKQFLNNSRFKTYIQAMQIEELWEEMMGKTVAKYTDKIQVIGTTLFITTNVAPLRNESVSYTHLDVYKRQVPPIRKKQ